MLTTRFNLLAMTILGSGLLVFGLSELSAAIYHADAPEKPGMKIDVAATEGEGEAAGGEAAAAVPLGTLLAKADPAKGQTAAKACAACHDFNKGGPNKTGPNLFGVVGRNHGSVAGFAYSEAMAGKSAEPWTYEALDAFLANPKTAVPGTKMVLAVKKAETRADILAYLAKLSDAPVPFPAP
ncbi:MAG: c-type cytochrome [Aestuariivirga sp.]